MLRDATRRGGHSQLRDSQPHTWRRIGTWRCERPFTIKESFCRGAAMFQRIIQLGKSTFALWSKERASSRGAAIAFYTVTSIAPIILLVIAIAGLVFGEEAARGAVFGQFSGLLGPKFAGILQNAIAGAASKSGGIAASVISVITLLLSASGVFVE